MQIDEQIAQFFTSSAFGVAGASTNRQKYGNKVLRCYLQHGKSAIPVNPRADEIEGIATVDSVSELPGLVNAISVITPPQISEQVVDQAIDKGIDNIWFQPGSESRDAVQRAKDAGLNVLAYGPCVLVVLGYRDSWVPEATL